MTAPSDLHGLIEQLRAMANYESRGIDMADELLHMAAALERLSARTDTGGQVSPARVAEQIKEGGNWRPCSGCQESVDGYVSARDYPYSKLFRCQPGCGCSECGGIGVVWEGPGYYDGYAEHVLAAETATADTGGEMVLPRDAADVMEDMRDFLATYREYIASVPASELERHPYLPAIDGVLEEAAALAAAPATADTGEVGEVTQADREAAATERERQYLYLGYSPGTLETPGEMRRGKRDCDPLAQAFARHRRSTPQQGER